METLQSQQQGNGHKPLVAELPGRVILAFDHLTSKEQEGVLSTVQTFARGETDGTRLASPEPLYMLRATPDVLVIVRREAGQPIEIEDIVRPATLRNFANAR